MALAQVSVVDSIVTVEVGGTALLAPLVAAAAASATAASGFKDAAEAAAGAAATDAAAGVAVAIDSDRVAAEAAATAAAGSAASVAGVVDSLSLIEVHGRTVTPTAGIALDALVIINGTPFANTGVIEEVLIRASGNGTIQFQLYDGPPGSMVESGAPTALVITGGAGDKVFPVSIAATAGQYWGFTAVSGAMQRTVATADGVGWYAGANAAAAKADTTLTTSQRLEIGVRLSYQAVTTEVLTDVSAIDTRLRQIEGAFTLSANKNLFDPTQCADNATIIPSGGVSSSQALTGTIYLGSQAVEANKSYVYSINDDVGFIASDRRFLCRNAAGNYIGYSSGSGAVANPPVLTWVDDRTVAFTVPSASLVRYVDISTRPYLEHTTADFDRVIASIQLEEGAVKTTLEPPSPDGMARLNALNGPDGGADATSPGTESGDALIVQKVGGVVYIRSHWSDTEDLVQKVNVTTGQSWINDVVSPYGAAVVAKDVLNTNDGYNRASVVASTYLAVQQDDATPVQYSSDFLGGTHGSSWLKIVNATAHGKTTADLGSVWTDTAARRFVLLRIVSVNQLWFLSENQATYPEWLFHQTMTGNLTHAEDATNTGTITVTSNTAGRFLPAVRLTPKVLLVDGEPVEDDGVYVCRRSFDIAEAYDIINTADQVQLARDNVGVEVDYADAALDGDLRLANVWRFSPSGACAGYQAVSSNRDIDLNYFGMVQAVPLQKGATDKYWWHVPGSLPITVGATIYDFGAGGGADTTAMTGLATLTDAYFADPAKPPYFSSQIVKDSGGVKKYSFAMGYTPDRGIGVPAVRAAVVDIAASMSHASQKQNLRAVTGSALGGTMVDDAYYEAVTFRAFTNNAVYTVGPEFFWYLDGDDVVVLASFDQAVTRHKLALPGWMTGRRIEELDSSAGVSLRTQTALGSDGLVVTTTGGGYIVARLT